MSSFHSLSVKNINRETNKANSISFDVPENKKKQLFFIWFAVGGAHYIKTVLEST